MLLCEKKIIFAILFSIFIQILFESAHARKDKDKHSKRKLQIRFPNRKVSESTESRLNRKSISRPNNQDDREAKGSRRKIQQRGRKAERKRKNNKENVLKTSIKAKIVTERKYLKKDWCKSQPVKQKIQTTSNCRGMIINQFCYGQCNSFYIPKDVITDPDEKIIPEYFKSCSFCKPKKEEWVSVRLRCRNIKRTGMPRFINKKIKRVKGCTCIAVPDLAERASVEIVINSENEEGTSTPFKTSTLTNFSSTNLL